MESPTLSCSAGQKHNWYHLYGSSGALAISQVAQQKPFMVITADSLSAQQLIEEIKFYADADLPLLNMPDWETLPYDIFSPHQDIISQRLLTLNQLPQLERGVLIIPATTLMHRLPPTRYVNAHSVFIRCHQRLTPAKLRQQLEHGGYCWVSQVMEHGEFALRGSLLDLFPMGSDQPYRIDFFDDEVDSIRSFDPETQRSLDTLTQIQLLPAREFPLNKEAISHFREQWRHEFAGDPTRCPLYQDISKGIAPAGIEYYLPLFFDTTQTLFDYLPAMTVILTTDHVYSAAEQFWQDIQNRYEQYRHDTQRPLLAPTQLFLKAQEVFAALHHYPHIHLTASKAEGTDFATQPPPQLPVEARTAQPLAALQQFLAKFPGRVLLTAETLGRRETLIELLKNHNINPKIVDNWPAFLTADIPLGLTVAPIERGILLEQLAVISENQLFGERVAQKRLRHRRNSQRDSDSIVRNLTELTLGAPVVHEAHGVGRYRGLVTLDVGGISAEFLHLEYARQDKLYVPVTSLHLVSRFTGIEPEKAPLHRLGSGQWEKAKRKAAQQVSDVAVELLDIYARRAARQGYAFPKQTEAYRAFAQAFPFEETPDQQEAIDTVLADMYAAKPMDRLICGDVGFGKTEVAMRAAFVAVLDGQQVAVLVPTTLLAQQHYQNFQDRFAEWPVKIEQLSRFCSKKQQEQALKAIADGQIDMVIGTHKLLHAHIQFKRLGLIIIDEEHRFGVKQKERLKALRTEVDILALTATPIPRSLNMALSHLRDLSIIATPPSRRLAIKTFIREWHTPTLVEAFQRELKRGGQVYFIHNSIEDIERIAEQIRQLLPEARIEIAHGQMRERALERVMQDFYHRRFNILVCTTIIETGIDVPNANTIIINRADKLGLAQLYQLRGRVGRSHHRAYAYLVVPPRKVMTPDALKRLDAIGALEELGMGFTLATHDLEIRGAGELLGHEQSGHMQEIGYNLYTELLERAVNALKSGQQPQLTQPLPPNSDINLYSPALLPSDYLPDVHTRLIMYKRIASATDSQGLYDIQVEMVDRFGLLPEPAKTLIKIAELKLKATALGIRKIEFSAEGGYLLFDTPPAIDPAQIVRLIQTQPQHYRLQGQNKLRLLFTLPDFSSRYQALERLLTQLSTHEEMVC